MHGLGGGDRRVGIAHGRGDDAAALDDAVGLYPEERWRPEDEIGKLALFHRADVLRDTMGDGGIDGIFRDIALGAHIVVVAVLFLEPPALLLHLVRGLPGAD